MVRLVACILLVAGLLLTPAFARADSLEITDAWARQTAPGGNGAIFMTLKNTGTADIRVTAARTDRADKAEIHESRMEDMIMKMVHLEDGVTVSAGSTISFAPGGLHVMLMGLADPLKVDETFDLSLQLADGTAVETLVAVKPIDYRPADKAMQHMDHSKHH